MVYHRAHIRQAYRKQKDDHLRRTDASHVTTPSRLVVFNRVNHPPHEQQTVCGFMVYEEEKGPVDNEGSW